MCVISCREILLNADLLNSAEHLKKEAVRFFLHFPNEVVATEKWKRMEKENPVALRRVEKFVLDYSCPPL